MKKATLSKLAIVSSVALATAPQMAQAQMGPYGSHWMERGWLTPWGVLSVLLLVAGVILVVWLLVRRSAPSSSQPSSGAGENAALRILQERFARGEIDKAEFEEKRRVLGF